MKQEPTEKVPLNLISAQGCKQRANPAADWVYFGGSGQGGGVINGTQLLRRILERLGKNGTFKRSSLLLTLSVLCLL